MSQLDTNSIGSEIVKQPSFSAFVVLFVCSFIQVFVYAVHATIHLDFLSAQLSLLHIQIHKD